MNKRIGELLIETGKLSPDDLHPALSEHKRSELRLGQYLIREGLLSEKDLADTLARQQRLPRYYPDKYPLDERLETIIPLALAQRFQIAPLECRRSLLSVAMVDPGDLEILEAVERHTEMETIPVVCTEQELYDIISRVYGENAAIGDMFGKIEGNVSESDLDENTLEISMIQNMVKEEPVVNLVNSILSQAVRDRASDVHISQDRNQANIRFRVDGRLHDVAQPSKAMIIPVISRLKLMANMDIAVFRKAQDGRIPMRVRHNKEIDIRVSTLPTIHGESMVLRILDTSSEIFSLEQLGIIEEDQANILKSLEKPYGMILSTGPTGCGKTTTLYAILQRLNRADINIITLEDPVEYRLDRIRQVHLNERAGMSFASGIRSLLRQDPDVIMVGEIRDPETASIAIQAGLTGHKVLSTLHTNDAASAITRFIDMNVPPFLISSVLLAVIGQRLVRKLCVECRRPFEPAPAALEYWGIPRNPEHRFYNRVGCQTCMNSGYKGRTGIFEVLCVTDIIQEMILEGRSARDIIQAARQRGFRQMGENAILKVASGLTTFDEILSITTLH